MPAAAAATQFRASYGDHLNARLPQQRVGISIAVIGEDGAWLQCHDVVPIIPLLAFGFVGVAAGGDRAQLVKSKCVAHDIEHRLLMRTNVETAIVAGWMHAIASDLADDIGEYRDEIAITKTEHRVEMHGRPALRHETANHSCCSVVSEK